MPTSCPKDDATLSSLPVALHDVTQPAVAYKNRQLDLVDPPNSAKGIFVFCFLAWRGVPGVTHNTFSSIASCLGAFLRVGFSEKNSFFLFSSFLSSLFF